MAKFKISFDNKNKSKASKSKKKDVKPKKLNINLRLGGKVGNNTKKKKYQLGGGIEDLSKAGKAVGQIGAGAKFGAEAIQAVEATGRKRGTLGGATATGALSGVAKGAALGTATGLPILGTVAGGIIGGIAGLAKGKREKAERDVARTEEVSGLVGDLQTQRGARPTLTAEGIRQKREDFSLMGRLGRLADGGEVNQEGVKKKEAASLPKGSPKIFRTKEGKVITAPLPKDTAKVTHALVRRNGKLVKIARPKTKKELELGRREGGLIGKAKAKKILEDKTVRGKRITEKQERFFGLIAGGDIPTKAGKTSQKKSEGGKIEGPGGPKEDKIDAKMKEGTFIAPAENAKVAMEIRKKFLGDKGNKKAKLQQGGGVDVKLSDQEVSFTPEEVALLRRNGIDLNALAPNAEPENKLQKGGEVRDPEAPTDAKEDRITELESAIELEKAKSGQETNTRIKSLQSQLRVARQQTSIDELRSFQEQLRVNRANIENALKLTKDVGEARALRDQLTELNKLGRQFPAIGKGVVSELRIPDISDVMKLSQAGKVQEAQRKMQDILGVEEQVTEEVPAKETPQEKSLSGAQRATQDVESNITDANKLKSRGDRMKEGLEGETIDTGLVDVDLTIPQTGPRVGKEAGFEEVRTSDIIAAEQEGREALSETLGGFEGVEEEGKLSQKKGEEDDEREEVKEGSESISKLVTGLGAGQVGAGLISLLGQGQRPEDKLSPELSREYQDAVKEAQFGLSDPERAKIEKGIRAGRVGATEAIKATTTNPARSFALIQNILTQGNKARVETEAVSARLREAKVARRAGLAGQLAAKRRRLFEDKMRAFEQNQAASAQLLKTGIENIVDAKRLKIEERKAEERKKVPAFNIVVPEI